MDTGLFAERFGLDLRFRLLMGMKPGFILFYIRILQAQKSVFLPTKGAIAPMYNMVHLLLNQLFSKM